MLKCHGDIASSRAEQRTRVPNILDALPSSSACSRSSSWAYCRGKAIQIGNRFNVPNYDVPVHWLRPQGSLGCRAFAVPARASARDSVCAGCAIELSRPFGFSLLEPSTCPKNAPIRVRSTQRVPRLLGAVCGRRRGCREVKLGRATDLSVKVAHIGRPLDRWHPVPSRRKKMPPHM